MTNNDYLYSALSSSNPNFSGEFKANCVAVLVADRHIRDGNAIWALYATFQIYFAHSGFLSSPECRQYVYDIVARLLEGGEEEIEAFEGQLAYVVRRLNGERQDN